MSRAWAKQLFVTPRSDIGYALKTPYRDGTTHVIFELLDFIDCARAEFVAFAHL